MIGGVSAVVLIKAETSRVNELAQQLVELKGVAEVFSVAGQYDLVAIVRVKENEELARRRQRKNAQARGRAIDRDHDRVSRLHQGGRGRNVRSRQLIGRAVSG